MAKCIVIVESPSKAKTINKYLGNDYSVMASYGHIRDLPAKNGSVEPSKDFAITWQLKDNASKVISGIKKDLASATKIILATDPDREGEAIAWHIQEILKNELKNKLPIERIVFNSITKEAILTSLKNPREIDSDLVSAYLARLALDYLIGFNLSPVLWKKLPSARSAGRVQSVTLKMIVEREFEIKHFKTEEYWDIAGQFTTQSKATIAAKLIEFKGEKLEKLSINNESQALAIKASLQGESFELTNKEVKEFKRNPYAPFITSTLQQEASKKLGFSSSYTMRLAQQLYEGVPVKGETMGLITYMRTDSIQITPDFIQSIRQYIQSNYANTYLPNSPRLYTSKQKNAQEAHEAIRPTQIQLHPNDIQFENNDLKKLYELIWKRTVASQMQSAVYERTSLYITSPNSQFKANGNVLMFDGFLTLYQVADDSEEEALLNLGDLSLAHRTLNLESIEANQHFTEPPARYTEASLIKRMEELGIGRPSTYSPTLQVLKDRNYVRLESKKFIPEMSGILVTLFLKQFFSEYVEYDFTANMEESLDEVSSGKRIWRELLGKFWTEFYQKVQEVTAINITHVLQSLESDIAFITSVGGLHQTCSKCNKGELVFKIAKYGPFVGCSNYPECNFVQSIQMNGEAQTITGEVKSVGTYKGQPIQQKIGRYGPYLQIELEGKPKNIALPKGVSVESLTELALDKLVSLPVVIGNHQESPVKIGSGPFGLYVAHNGRYYAVKQFDDFINLTLEEAIALIESQKDKPKRPSRFTKKESTSSPKTAAKTTSKAKAPKQASAKAGSTTESTSKPKKAATTKAKATQTASPKPRSRKAPSK